MRIGNFEVSLFGLGLIVLGVLALAEIVQKVISACP